MANKKLLTYEGLEEYNIKWHERLQSLVIDADDVEEIFVDAMMENYTWSYEFDTTYGFPQKYNGSYQHPWYYSSLDYPYVLGVVPFTLYGSENASMTIDWGDGTVETVTSSMYQYPVVFESSVHEYATPGKYTISVTSSDWDQIYMVGGCSTIGYYSDGTDGKVGVYDERILIEKEISPDMYGHPFIYDNGDTLDDYYYSAQNIMSLMRYGCYKINNPLPKLAGTVVSELYYNYISNSTIAESPVQSYSEPEFADLPKYGQYLDDQLYFILDDSHILGSNYPEDLFVYNKNSEIIGAFGEIDEVNGVKTPHVYVDIPETWTESANGTLNLALGNAFSYWPEGAGTKTVSITNGTTSGLSKFFLKLTDAGNFPMQWGNNIQWKNGSEPVWQAFNEDIIMFTSNDGGNTWTGQIVQTTAITPYWKFTIDAKTRIDHDHYNMGYDYEYGHGAVVPFRNFEYGAIIDWGDGTIQNITMIDPAVNYNAFGNGDRVDFPTHVYSIDGYYQVKIEYDHFDDVCGYNWIAGDDVMFETFVFYTKNIISIDSPLPTLKGMWVDCSTSFHYESNVRTYWDMNLSSVDEFQYTSLESVPDKLLNNN